MWHDLRQAARTLLKHPAFVVIAALVLALGIGLNTAIFTVVYAMLWAPLPVASPGTLVYLYEVYPRQPDRPGPLGGPFFERFRDAPDAFSGMTAHWGVSYFLHADDETDAINAEWVVANYFDVLGVKPALGRALIATDDDAANPDHAVVISDALWVKRFHSDPAVIGKQIELARWNETGTPWTVVGIMPPGFKGLSAPWRPTQVWLSFAQASDRSINHTYTAPIARLKPGVTLAQARAMVAAQGHAEFVDRFSRYGEYEPHFAVYPASDVRMPFDPSAAVIPARLAGALSIVVAMVLLVAATNIAGILMARGVGRSGEIAVRRVLGAGPLRIARQLLAESLLISLLGGALGFVLAVWLVALFRAWTPVQYAFDISINSRAGLFTAAVCAAAGIVVGILPARQASRLDVLSSLAGTGSIMTKQTRSHVRHAITVPQVALSLVLLLVAGVYVRALLRVELADLGYQPSNLLAVQAGLTEPRNAGRQVPPQQEERRAERARRYYRQLLDRLRAVPGAVDVGVAYSLPLAENAGRPNWTIVTQENFYSGDRSGPGTERTSVSPGYFAAMGMRVNAGRDFDERDTPKTPKVAVMSAALAQRVWPGRDPVGRAFTMINAFPSTNEKIEWYEVAGIVNDVQPILAESAALPLVYFPLGQEWWPNPYNVLARAAGDSRLLIPAVKAAVEGADPLAEVYRVRTLSQIAAEVRYPRRLAGITLAISGAIALVLATIGVYGVVSYSVAQRTGEIGVRMALGAGRGDIIRLVLREARLIALLGTCPGLLLGYIAIRTTSSRFLALPHLDVITMVVTPLLMAAVVLLACYMPARRAGRVDPMEVLRRA